MSALDPSDLGEDARDGVADELFGQDQGYFPQSDTSELFGNDSVSMVSQDAFDNNKLATKTGTEKADATNMTVDNVSVLNSEVNSPRETVSPTASSPFSAMESDGEGIETGQDDANLSCTGDQSFNRNNGYFGASTPLNTTTPCASSSCCDDDYDPMASRKKRRKTRRDMHHVHSGLNVVPVMKQPNSDWPQDNETSPFSPPTCPKAMNFEFGSKNLRTSGGRSSNPQEDDYDGFPPGNAKRTRKCTDPVDEEMTITNIKTETPSNMDSAMAMVQTTPVTKRGANQHNRPAVTADDEQLLHRQYQRKSGSYELHIVTQPEPQHRARYLTEGSRGPVKDATQTGFPKVQLLGYTRPVILQVFVATDSGKIKPHGFYQACRVTGRNTSPCEEIEIQGTKVIEIPFKQEDGCMVLNIDCVGILKLRNTDVEVRTGLRNQKRNQSVRLIFRVALKATSPNGSQIVLQVASTRISCTQPLGQPEITKKSIDRCSVEGGTEMFIIGKNFHRGTKVIYQDPEEPDGKQWTAEGEIEKDTFHQYHMVVRVPPYHDQNIVKPVNVQLIVEFHDKKCEPHSFTYTPKPKEPEPVKEETKQAAQAVPSTNIESAFNNMLEGPIDKKFLVALFSKLLSDSSQGESPSGTNTPNKGDVTAGNCQATINTQSLLSAVLQNQASSTPLQTMKDAAQAGDPNPVSPPSTLFASISVQNPQPAFSNSITNNTSLQPHTLQAFLNSNAVGNVSSPIGNIDPSAINAVRLIKSEPIGAEPHPNFSVTTTVPFQVCKSEPTSMAIGNLPSVAVTMTETVASPNMLVSPVSGQTFPTSIQQAVCYNSFNTSHPMIGTLISSAPGLAVSATHQSVSQFNNVQAAATITDQVVKVPINDGFPQSTGTMSTVSVGGNGNTPATFPVTNFQVNRIQQNQQNLLANATTMTVPTLIQVQPSPAVADVEHAQFSQGATSISLQNNQGLSRSNVLQQPTFTFQQNTNVVTTAVVQNPQITATAVSTSQGLNSGQSVFGDQVHLTVGADGQNHGVVIATPQNQQSFAIFTTDGSHPQTAAIPLAAKDIQNLPSFANSLSHNINQPSFIVQPQNHPMFHQQQQFSAQAQSSSNSLPNVFQGNNAFPQHQFSQMQRDENPGSNHGQVQHLSAGSHSDEKQMQVDSFPATQNSNQLCPATRSPIDAMSVQTAIPAMSNILTQNFTNSQVSSVMIEDHQMSEVVPAGNQPQFMAINISSQHIAMTAEPSPSSTSETSPPTVTDNNQAIQTGFGVTSGIGSQTFQAPPSADTPMIHEPTANQPMELGQSNMPSAQVHPNFHLQQQQQPSQNSNLTIGHDEALTRQNFQVDHTANIHESTGYSGLQHQVTRSQSFQATNTSSGVRSGEVEIGANGGLQQTIQSTNNVTNFQCTPLANDDVTTGNFNPHGFQTMQKPTQLADMGQAFQGPGTALRNVHSGSNLDNFQHSLQQKNPSVMVNDDNSGNLESHGFQGLQHTQSINLPMAQNFQAHPNNFNATTTVLDQQNLQPKQQTNVLTQPRMVVDNFQPQSVRFPATQGENVTNAVTFVVSDQQYQATNQSTQNSQPVVKTGNTPNQDFTVETKAHVINNLPQVNANFSYDGNSGMNLPQDKRGDLQAPALHQMGHLQPQQSRTNTTVSRPLEPQSPDIYVMREVLRSINGEQELAAISGEDVQRHCQ